MGNKVVNIIAFTIFLFIWAWVGHQEHYAMNGHFADGWLAWSLLVVAVGAGQAGDADNSFVAALDALKAFFPTLIVFAIASVLLTIIWTLVDGGAIAFDGILDNLSEAAAASVLTVPMLSSMRRC
jgi:hypothetical protein